MSDILYAAIILSFFIGGSICAVGICIMQKFDDLKHEIWELRMDLQDEKPEEKMKVDVVPSGIPLVKNKDRYYGCSKCEHKDYCADAFLEHSYKCNNYDKGGKK